VTGFIVWEWWKLRRTAGGYPWREALLSVAVALVRRVLLLLGGSAVTFAAYEYAWDYHWLHIPLSFNHMPGLLNGFLLFLSVEFIYYWQHRTMHQVRWFWTDHSVHHSPNRLVFLVAERLGWLSTISGIALFFAPLCLIGFPPRAVLGMVSFNLLYQFWLHTEQIGKLGWFEYLFNTPSHHRVHHAANPRYLDANYGGVLIIYDRLFGTFIEESADEPVVFGLVKPQTSSNPFVVALSEWRAMLMDALRNWRHPLWILGYLFNVPGWSHDGSRLTSAMIREQARSKS
ncbi:MAG TPA: sterol desaturase family protein, partial [Candidatus Acidoferrum sp.]|nr:sterol desaturase family protein [Candidatus Acidoferrum sp.]